jgi:hypothetical protein
MCWPSDACDLSNLSAHPVEHASHPPAGAKKDMARKNEAPRQVHNGLTRLKINHLPANMASGIFSGLEPGLLNKALNGF